MSHGQNSGLHVYREPAALFPKWCRLLAEPGKTEGREQANKGFDAAALRSFHIDNDRLFTSMGPEIIISMWTGRVCYHIPYVNMAYVPPICIGVRCMTYLRAWASLCGSAGVPLCEALTPKLFRFLESHVKMSLRRSGHEML